jgi:hypothetical protein
MILVINMQMQTSIHSSVKIATKKDTEIWVQIVNIIEEKQCTGTG